MNVFCVAAKVYPNDKLSCLCVLAIMVALFLALSLQDAKAAEKYIFEDQHKPNRVKGIPGGFVGKPWSEVEKKQILDLLQDIENLSPGFIKKLTYYRPLRAYRATTGGTGAAWAPAHSYEETNAVVFLDSFFARGEHAMRGTLIHELAHVADVGRRISKSKEWADLIHPRINAVRAELAQVGTTVMAAVTQRKHSAVAHKHGLPSLYAATAAGEALPEVVAYHLVGRSYKTPEDIKRFVETTVLQAPISRDPAVEAYHRCGEATDRSEYDEAIDACSEAIEHDAAFSGAYMLRGYNWRMKKVSDKAIDDFASAIGHGHTDLDMWYVQLGLTRFETNDCKNAIDDFADAKSINPQNSSAFEWSGICKIAIGDHAGAYKEFDQAIILSPDQANLYAGRGDSHRLRKNCKDAVTDYDKAIGLRPDYSLAHKRRAECKKMVKDYPGAIADYSTLISLQPENADYYMERAKLHALTGSNDKAIADFEQVKRIKPDRTVLIDRIMRGLNLNPASSQ